MPASETEKLGEQISAYLDGELSDAERKAVEAKLRKDPSARRLFERLQHVSSLVGSLPRHGAPPVLVDAWTTAAERDHLLDGANTSRRSGTAWILRFRYPILAAAVLLMVCGVWFEFFREGTPPTATHIRVDFGPEPSKRLAMRSDEGGAAGPASPAMARQDMKPSRDRIRGEFDASTTSARPSGAHPTGPTPTTRFAETEAIENMSMTAALEPTVLRRLVEASDLEQKIRAGVQPDRLVEHAFANEKIQLQLTFASAQSERAAIAWLSDSMRQRGAVTPDQLDADAPVRHVLLAGRPGVNYAQADEDQVMVRLRRSELPDVIEGLKTTSGPSAQAVFRVGPVEAEGWDNADRLALGDFTAYDRPALRRADRTWDAPAATDADRNRRRVAKAPTSTMEWVLRDLVGVLLADRRSTETGRGGDDEAVAAAGVTPPPSTLPPGTEKLAFRARTKPTPEKKRNPTMTLGYVAPESAATVAKNITEMPTTPSATAPAIGAQPSQPTGGQADDRTAGQPDTPTTASDRPADKTRKETQTPEDRTQPETTAAGRAGATRRETVGRRARTADAATGSAPTPARENAGLRAKPAEPELEQAPTPDTADETAPPARSKTVRPPAGRTSAGREDAALGYQEPGTESDDLKARPGLASTPTDRKDKARSRSLIERVREELNATAQRPTRKGATPVEPNDAQAASAANERGLDALEDGFRTFVGEAMAVHRSVESPRRDDPWVTVVIRFAVRSNAPAQPTDTPTEHPKAPTKRPNAPAPTRADPAHEPNDNSSPRN